KPRTLIDWIIQFSICIRKLLAVNHQFEPLYQPGLTAVFFGEGAHLNRVVNNECRLYIVMFAFFAENFVDELPFTHAGIGRDPQLGAHRPEARFIHFTDVKPSMFLDGIVDAYTWIGRGE